MSATASDGVASLTAVAAEVRAQQIEIADIALRRPTLDEAFLRLTGSPPVPAPDPDPTGSEGDGAGQSTIQPTPTTSAGTTQPPSTTQKETVR